MLNVSTADQKSSPYYERKVTANAVTFRKPIGLNAEGLANVIKVDARVNTFFGSAEESIYDSKFYQLSVENTVLHTELSVSSSYDGVDIEVYPTSFPEEFLLSFKPEGLEVSIYSKNFFCQEMKNFSGRQDVYILLTKKGGELIADGYEIPRELEELFKDFRPI